MSIEKLGLAALAAVVVLLIGLVCQRTAAADKPAPWREPSNRTVLKNETIHASFQSGIPCLLKDVRTGEVISSIDPVKLPAKLPLFGPAAGLVDLDIAAVKQKVTADSVQTTLSWPDGTEWELRWTIEPGGGDLVLQSSAHLPRAVEEIRFFVLGCDIAEHSIVWVDPYGVGRPGRGPSNESFVGDPLKDGSPMAFPMPLVALFQGKADGWFIEGRDLRVGPASVMGAGRGMTLDLGMVRRFGVATRTPEMYEIRIRTYKDRWETAVEPFVRWMETGGGYVPLEKKSPAWIKDITNQAYITVGNFEGLERLARRVDPARTFIGRQGEYRKYAFDVGYPNYEPTETARQWFRRARELGFHLGAHFNSMCVSRLFPEIVEKMKPAFQPITLQSGAAARSDIQITGSEAKRAEVYDGLNDGQLIYCSSAYKPFRDLLIESIRPAVEAGVDVIYLDQAMAPGGRFVVDGVDGYQGLIALEKELMEAFPQAAIETEQFNPLASRHAAFALSQMPLGHPLGAYLFHRFVKVVPEGVMSEPVDEPLMDALQSWGCMTPGAQGDEAWLQIIKAIQTYGLAADFSLPRHEFAAWQRHPSLGLMPVAEPIRPGESQKLFGYRGRDGVTAYYEKESNRRGLVVYEQGKPPQWVGTRHYGIRTWPGPGAPHFEQMGRRAPWWLLYDGPTVLGLDPKRSYLFTDDVKLPAERFHVTRLPEDYAGYCDGDRRIISQEIGTNDCYCKVVFTGHGQVRMSVPDDVDVYMDGLPLRVDRQNRSAAASVAATEKNPATLLAVKRLDVPLKGRWIDLPWQRAWHIADYVWPNEAGGFSSNTSGVGYIVGKLPEGRALRLQGAYGIRQESIGPFGDGVIRINGKQILRVPHGDRPFRMRDFDVDITALAGQYILLEFHSDGEIHGATTADWNRPRIVVEP